MYYLYILKCRDGSLYTGITTDLKRRVGEHHDRADEGSKRPSASDVTSKRKGAKYTRGRGPFELVYSKRFKNRSNASKEEYRIKSLSRIEKLKLIKGH